MLNFISQFAATITHCNPGTSLLSFPTWYQYLPCDPETNVIASFELNHIWLIAAAIIEIILRIGVIAAVVFMIWGSIRMIVSSGKPDQVAMAKSTLVNAGIGLMISILATTAVAFIAGRIADGSTNVAPQNGEASQTVPHGVGG